MKLPKPKSNGEETLALQLRAEKLRNYFREYEFAPGRKWRFDFAWPQRKLAIEVDGGNRMVRRTKNGGYVAVGRHTSEKDAEKLNTAALMGWRVLRYTPRQVESGEALAAIQEALR